MPQAHHCPRRAMCTPAAWAWWPRATWPWRWIPQVLPERGEAGAHPRHHQPLRDPRHGARAHRYFLTAERFGAAEALRIGFVHEVVTADELMPRWTNCSRP